MRPADLPPMVMSKKTLGLDILMVVGLVCVLKVCGGGVLC